MDYLRPKEVCELLKISKSTFWNYTKRDIIKVKKISTRVLLVSRIELQDNFKLLIDKNNGLCDTVVESAVKYNIALSTLWLFIKQGLIKTHVCSHGTATYIYSEDMEYFIHKNKDKKAISKKRGSKRDAIDSLMFKYGNLE